VRYSRGSWPQMKLTRAALPCRKTGTTMETSEARKIVHGLSAADRVTLSSAHSRYMHFTGVYTGEVSADVIAEDRATFAHVLKWDDEGRPSLSDQRCADFMAAITGLARESCLAWDEVDFVDTHGEDFFEAQHKLQESDRLARDAGRI
jgi:hypothetical protein